MRHRKSGRKFGMDSTARMAMFRNMVTSLMLHGQIRTTEARAKDLRAIADKVITIGKRAPKLEGLEGEALMIARAQRVHAIRRAKLWVNDDTALKRVFGEYAERLASRPGGYTRVIKAANRPGDNSPMAYIQVVEALVTDGEVAEAQE